MPVDYKKYPPDWRDVIRPEVLKRFGYKCADCGAGQRQLFTKLSGKRQLIVGDFEREWHLKNGHKISTIYLSISHTNHDINDNRPENLKPLCQQCHLSWDKEWHKVSRIARKSLPPRK